MNDIGTLSEAEPEASGRYQSSGSEGRLPTANGFQESEGGEAPSGAEPSAAALGVASDDDEVDREPGLLPDLEGFDAGSGPSALPSAEAPGELEHFPQCIAGAGPTACEEEAVAMAAALDRIQYGFAGDVSSVDTLASRKRNASQAHATARAAAEAAAGARAMALEIESRRSEIGLPSAMDVAMDWAAREEGSEVSSAEAVEMDGDVPAGAGMEEDF
eukprot:CAMPEP_0196720854 /NCGR_PEP_ID=MMETSP1091-20130531/3551_1 /TAXON_ID=302021 /ORGANISM="Rhodomonas sp., Strain CCMP768" /LENGTH=216 /DNA_ID=CAMNT_0042062193 /DNA_START=259 /DNA_END=909 /DNA_ORIENTATION=+